MFTGVETTVNLIRNGVALAARQVGKYQGIYAIRTVRPPISRR
jgi:hypothetical protein